MEKFNTIKSLKSHLTLLQEEGNIGFVPTMGALHDGHLQLVKRCAEENKFTVVSIFVNPTQFNDKSDLKKYPRDTEGDINKLNSVNDDIIIFIPEAEEIYPDNSHEKLNYDLKGLDKYMEGAHRPGHFNGVAMVVDRLFQIVEPDNAYFGEKDFQQLAIIKLLVQQKQLPVKIISCPTVREKNNLAMSSRNLLLSPETRLRAGLIYDTLFKATKLQLEMSVNEVKKWVEGTIENSGFLELEYFELVDNLTLNPIITWEQSAHVQGCIAVKTEGVRLIDNVKFYD